jgi:hypothetical protein
MKNNKIPHCQKSSNKKTTTYHTVRTDPTSMNNKHSFPTVHAYVAIHFLIVCGLFEWKQICAGFSSFVICIVLGDIIKK